MFCHFDNYYSVAAVEHVKCSVYLVCISFVDFVMHVSESTINTRLKEHLDIVVVDTKLYFCCVELLLLCVESVEPHTCLLYTSPSPRD